MKTLTIWMPIVLILIVALACNSSAPGISPTETAPSTLAPVAPTSTAVPVSSSTPDVPVIQHVIVPGEPPQERTSYATDQDSFLTSTEKRAPGGDRFTFGKYERPFNGLTMDTYFPQVDIQETVSYFDSTWIYFSLTVKSWDVNQELSGKYGYEIDSDVDGYGDWLMLVSRPSVKEWTTDGVEVWYDSNNDVGGSTPVFADDQSAGDGYETRIFNQGEGDDPDLAWARIQPGQPFTIQFAIKWSLIENAKTYMAGAWAGGDMLDPWLFDLNDHFTHEQAGTSLVELEFFYPIKAIAELDNTCRVAIGFKPAGNEPGLCQSSEGDVCTPPQKMVCVDTVYGPSCYCSQP